MWVWVHVCMCACVRTMYYVSLISIQAGSTTVEEAIESKKKDVHKSVNSSSATAVCVSLVRLYVYVQCVSLTDQSHMQM